MPRRPLPANQLRAGARLISRSHNPPGTFVTAARNYTPSSQYARTYLPSTISAPAPARTFSTTIPRPQPQLSSQPTIHTTVTPIPSSSTPGTLATITVSNPRKLNIVNSALFQQLHSALKTVSQSPDLRAIVLTGDRAATAASFVGGADIAEMFAISSPDQARAFIAEIHAVCTAMRAAPVPVIARVDGFCLGAGLELAASCDLRIATRRSTFGMPEVRVGIPCVVEARLLCDLVGWGRARRLVFLAENVDAATAERWGLVEEVVEDAEELDARLAEWVGRLAEAGPKAIRDQKVLNQKWEEGNPDFGIEAGIEAFAGAFEDGGQEPKRLMGAFVNRKR